jgi:RTX calcium-binding nonapeptide repeat (4 copies)
VRRGFAFLIVAAATLFFLPASVQAAPACTITGSGGADVLRGTKGPDVICARGGSDEVLGRAGADVVRGGRGNDVLRGGAGADRLIGGPGKDSCRDGRGTTYFRGCEPRRGKRLGPGDFFPCCVAAGGPPDLTPPEVNGVHFSGPYVDTSSESSIGLWIDASDSNSGIGHVELELHGPAGPWRELAFESDSPYTGASASVEVPASTPAGKYRVASLSLADRAGNRVSYGAAELAAAGFDAEFDVFEGPDTEGPQLTGYSLTPDTLDTSLDPGAVRFSLTATDDLSGVDDAAALVLLPDSGPPLCFPCGHRARSELSSGTIYDGVWEEDLPLPRFARPGTYLVSAVVLYDRAGNRTDYGREELEGLGYLVEFTQTGAGDTEPPEIVDFWMSPSTVRSSSGNGAIQFFIRVEDDLSGVGESEDSVFERLRVDIQPPHPSEWWYTDGGMTQVSGTELDGVWRFEKILPGDAETGTWTIPAIEATDRAGNETLLKDEELLATGWDLTFENLP